MELVSDASGREELSLLFLVSSAYVSRFTTEQ